MPRPLKIFVDLATPPDLLDLLQSGTRGHQLLQPLKPVASVLAEAAPDPQIALADIAFGQPTVRAIAEAPGLQWVHVSSSGITRYDNPEFRALAAERKLVVTNSAAVYAEACAVHVLSFLLAQARQLPLGLRTRAANGAS